jgi:putative ABC transport system permease protein
VNLAGLAWRYLWARPMVAALNVLMLALGIAAIVFVVLVAEQLERQAERDLAGIDLVVGAKGSPLQLILAGVFHVDLPPGNIPLAAARQLREHPLVARVVPLALGDAVQGYRIVGTTAGYLELYGVRVEAGRAWAAPMEVVLGAGVAAATGWQPGATFAGAHGLGSDGPAHADRPYTVVGRLGRCGCALDRLVLTATESVWSVHAHAGGHADDEPGEDEPGEDERELTLLLVSYRSPLAAVTLPRWVNAQPRLQAAVPAVESARLFGTLGVGLDVLRGFGLVMIAVAALSLFVALTHAVRERAGDLAMLRLLGAPARRVAALLACEALWLALLALGGGLAAGHLLAHWLGWALQAGRSLPLTGWWWSAWHPVLVAGAVALALAAVALPVARVLRLDVTTLLQSPR